MIPMRLAWSCGSERRRWQPVPVMSRSPSVAQNPSEFGAVTLADGPYRGAIPFHALPVSVTSGSGNVAINGTVSSTLPGGTGVYIRSEAASDPLSFPIQISGILFSWRGERRWQRWHPHRRFRDGAIIGGWWLRCAGDTRRRGSGSEWCRPGLRRRGRSRCWSRCIRTPGSVRLGPTSSVSSADQLSVATGISRSRVCSTPVRL